MIVLLIVFGVTVGIQFAVEAILGEEAAANGEAQGQSCVFALGWLKLGCSATFQSNPQSAAAAQLGQELITPFVILDAIFVLAVAYVVVVSMRTRSSGRQLGAGKSRRRA